MRLIITLSLLMGCAHKPKTATEDVKVMLQAADTFKRRVDNGFYGDNPQLENDAKQLWKSAKRAYKDHIKTRCYTNRTVSP